MTRIVLEYQHSEQITASVDPATREIRFDNKVVTGKMWLVFPDRRYVEVMPRDGSYYLEPAA